MAISEATLVERLGKSDRMVRNYAKTIEQVTGKNPQAGPREYHDWSVAEFDAIVAAGGPKSYERQHAQPVAPQPQPQPEPIAPVQPVYEMATNPGHQLASQAQPAAIAFQVVEIDPGGQLATVPAVSSGPSNLVPFAPVSQVAQSNIQSAQNAIAVVRSMAQGMRSRLEIGNDVSWQQQQIVNDELAALDLEIAELEIAGQLHRQQQIRTQAVQNLAGSEVGKRLARLQQLASANGYQLQPLSS